MPTVASESAKATTSFVPPDTSKVNTVGFKKPKLPNHISPNIAYWDKANNKYIFGISNPECLTVAVQETGTQHNDTFEITRMPNGLAVIPTEAALKSTSFSVLSSYAQLIFDYCNFNNIR